MFRVLDTRADGAPVVSEGAADVQRPPDGTIRWIDLRDQDEAQLALLAQRFELHPLAIEDCAHFDQRAKLEEYGGYLFVVMHGFVGPGDPGAAGGGGPSPPQVIDDDPTHAEPVELHAFLGHGFLITVHTQAMPALETVWQRAAHDPTLGRRGADFLYYLVVDAVVDSDFELLDHMSEALDAIEDAVLQRSDGHELGNIFTLKRALVTQRRLLSPQRDVFALLSKRGSEYVGERTAVYFRDVYDHLTRIYESIDTARDLLGNALDAYLSMVAQRTNEIVKRLTILSAVFLPLTFVTGFFGQNFELLPIHTPWVYYAVAATCFALPAGMLYWFRKSRWL